MEAKQREKLLGMARSSENRIYLENVIAYAAMGICQEISQLTDAVQSLEETLLSFDKPASAKRGAKK